MTRGRRRRSGNSLLEFTLVGIPLIFVLISTFQMSLAMWLYDTLAFAVKQGTRYVVVHGVNCSTNGNTYCASVSNVAAVINTAARGLDPNQMTVTLTPSSGSVTTDTLANLMSGSTYATTNWPPTSAKGLGKPVTISVLYPFNSGISMFWVGTRPVTAHGRTYLPASSTDLIQF
jgi:Flp pilus assembly protein TadG